MCGSGRAGRPEAGTHWEYPPRLVRSAAAAPSGRKGPKCARARPSALGRRAHCPERTCEVSFSWRRLGPLSSCVKTIPVRVALRVRCACFFRLLLTSHTSLCADPNVFGPSRPIDPK